MHGSLTTPVQQKLYDVYVHWLNGGQLGPAMNFALIALIPKGSKDEDATLLARSPDETRPISQNNTDGTNMALAVNSVIAPVLDTYIDH